MNENHDFIRLDGLSKSFQEGGRTRTVLRGADAEFAQGEFVAILGKSGSGKSTLLNLISGIDLVDRGRHLGGRPEADRPGRAPAHPVPPPQHRLYLPVL